MMMLSGKQAHVLDNIERVVPRAYSVEASHRPPRYELDGLECTPQITGLVVRKLISRLPGGRVERAANGVKVSISPKAWPQSHVSNRDETDAGQCSNATGARPVG